MPAYERPIVATPSRPFPHQAVHALDAKPDPGGTEIEPPTLIVSAVTELRDLTAVYLQRFEQEGAPRGQAVALRGEHGSGKTHAIGHLRRQVAAKKIAPGCAEDVLQLYAKVESPDLTSVYRTLMAQISHARMRDVAARFTAQLAGESIKMAYPDDPEAVTAIRARLVAEPGLADTLVNEYLVDAGDVLRRRDEEIARVTETDDFRSVLPYLFTDLADIAYDWLVGRDLDAMRLRSIGVSRSIDTPELAQHGLHLLATMCGRAGTALVVYIDQYEKLVLDRDQQLVAETSGMLHSLAESIPGENGMIVIAGNQEAWDKLPVDLRQRFGYRVVETRPYELAETAALVHLYLHPRTTGPVLHDLPPAEFAPFTIAAIETLHSYSGGRPRGLLELCARTWGAGDPPAAIDADEVREAGESGRIEPVEPHGVLDRVRRIAYASGLFVRDVTEGGTPALFISGADGLDRVLVMVGSSRHYYDEVIGAGVYEAALARLQSSASEPKPRAVVIVLGYESPEVRGALQQAGVTVLAVATEGFDAAVTKLLDEAGGAPAVPVDARLDETTRQLAELRETLAQLAAEREETIRGLEVNVATLDRHQTDQRLVERWEKADGDWVSERRGLVERIAEARRRRRSEELEELERLREHAEGERSRRLVRQTALAGVGAACAFAGIALLGRSQAGDQAAFAAQIGALLALAAMVASNVLKIVPRGRSGLISPRPDSPIRAWRDGLWVWRDLYFRPRELRELAAPVISAADLRRLAHAAWRRSRPHAMLRHENPQFRAAAAVLLGGDDPDLLVDAMVGERCGLVRRMLAQSIAQERGGPVLLGDAIDFLLRVEVPEVRYVLDELLSRGLRTPELDDVLWSRVLAGLYDDDLDDFAPAARALTPILRRDRVERLGPVLSAPLGFGSRDALLELPIDAVRAAVRELSPFEPPGIGTFDELRVIDKVDAAVIVLSQVLFLSELGLLVQPG